MSRVNITSGKNDDMIADKRNPQNNRPRIQNLRM